MNDIIKIPYLNPLRFFRVGSGHFGNVSRSAYEAESCYVQKFLKSDVLKIRTKCFLPSMAAISYEIYNAFNDIKVLVKAGDWLFVAGEDPNTVRYWGNGEAAAGGYNIIEFLEPGRYYAIIKTLVQNGGSLAHEYFASNIFEVSEAQDSDSLLIEYRHYENNYDMPFYTTHTPDGDYFQIRVEGGVWAADVKQGSNDKVYIDQNYGVIRLSAVPFSTFELTVGNARGIPAWLANKINRALCLSDIRINGKPFVKADGAKIEMQTPEKHPFSSYKIEMVEAEVKHSLAFGQAELTGDFNNDFDNDYF